MEKKYKVLFFHNSIPEYRVEFWRLLGKFVDLKLIITNKNLEKKIYDLEYSLNGLNINYFDNIKKLKSNIYDADFIIFPSVDSLKEFLVCIYILRQKKARGKKIYWSEKWEAPWGKQPFLKRAKNLMHRILIKSIAQKADLCIASGSKSKEYLKMIGIAEKKIKVVFDSSTSQKNKDKINIFEYLKMDKPQNVILYLGRLVNRKGCIILIDAVKDILKSFDCILLICGDGELKGKCIEEVKANKLEERVYFLGKVQPKYRRLLYEQSTMFVLPSICENGTIEAWGLTINEALECGTPVIASNIVGAAFDLINDFNGIIVKENDSEELNHAIVRILNNKEYYDRERIMKEYDAFSVKNMAESFYSVMNF